MDALSARGLHCIAEAHRLPFSRVKLGMVRPAGTPAAYPLHC